MNKKVLSYLLIIFTIILTIYFLSNNRYKHSFVLEVNQFIKESHYSHLFNDVSVNFYKNSAKLTISLNETFIELPLREQFTTFSHFYLAIKLILKTQSNPLYSKNINIYATYLDNIFQYEDTHKNKSLIFTESGLLKINNKSYPAKAVIKDYLCHHHRKYMDNKTKNGYLEKDILDFMGNFYRNITKNFQDAQSNDYQLALDATHKKYKLSPEEIEKILYKWIFYYD
ncbi:hypothetical protein [Bacillus sp. 1P06AnD]|uniref:hypothetical protein n=1 Tax=Bacillus sp. 1P06AnD TaxID=3132208 RepID=UPI0039A0B61C